LKNDIKTSHFGNHPNKCESYYKVVPNICLISIHFKDSGGPNFVEKKNKEYNYILIMLQKFPITSPNLIIDIDFKYFKTFSVDVIVNNKKKIKLIKP